MRSLVMMSIASSLFFAAPARGEQSVIIVVGAGGAPEYAAEFSASADRWAKAAAAGGARIVQIGRGPSAVSEPATEPTSQPTTIPGSDKELLREALSREVAETIEPLWIVFIGHGTSDGRESKFNLRGPDVSDQELADWLRPVHRPLAFIDCSSASSPFLNRLSAKGRVIITATRSASEIQFSRFGDYLSSAIADPAADLDKDGQTSLLEAFLAASHQTDEFYKQAGRLVTEHALLDDNGDALGISADFFQGVRAVRSARNGAPLDGARANQWCLVRSASERGIPPDLRARRDELELAIDALRIKKSTLAEASYYAQLEEVLLKLARIYGEIDTQRQTSRPATE